MRRAALVAPLILLNGCGDAGTYAHWGDRLSAATGGLFGQPCSRGETDRLPDDQCYRMTPPERMRGIWIDEFEGSRFLPGLTAAPATDPPGPHIWLEMDAHPVPALPEERRGQGRVVLLDFIGRRTLYPGNYGHLGMSEHEVVVQRLISAREIAPGARSDAEPVEPAR